MCTATPDVSVHCYSLNARMGSAEMSSSSATGVEEAPGPTVIVKGKTISAGKC